MPGSIAPVDGSLEAVHERARPAPGTAPPESRNDPADGSSDPASEFTTGPVIVSDDILRNRSGSSRIGSTRGGRHLYRSSWLLRCWQRTRRHPIRAALLAAFVLLAPVWWSLGSALTNPALGVSASARAAEWVRDHGGRSIVVWAENTWYSLHPPPVGGKPPAGKVWNPATRHAGSTAATGSGSRGTASPTTTLPPTLPSPLPLAPVASPPIPGEGQWKPAGRYVDGVPAIYETFMRPDSVHTSVVDGIAWMDTDLLSATLYSGTYIPGGGPWTNSAPISPSAAETLVAAFNAGFRMQDSQGGYYTEGKMVAPLRAGAASLVIYDDGSVNIGAWGTDMTMSPGVASVRQNLVLLVDGGRPAADLNSNDTSVWGYTLGNKVFVWRSGVGITADGALVYVGGPDLNITDLADLLVRAGAIRAMELDINTGWVNFATYQPSASTGVATPADGTDLLSTMSGSPSRYFTPSWSRDFFTMSARNGAPGRPNPATSLGAPRIPVQIHRPSG